MFDNNPFREFKEMMKQRRLQEENAYKRMSYHELHAAVEEARKRGDHKKYDSLIAEISKRDSTYGLDEPRRMMREENRPNSEDGFPTGAGADYDSAKEHEKFVQEISGRLQNHDTTGEHLGYIQQIGHHNLTGEHIHTILTDIEQERDNAGHDSGRAFNPVHSQLIDILKKSRGYDAVEHGRRIAEMEYASKKGERGSSASREADKRADLEIRLRKDGM